MRCCDAAGRSGSPNDSTSETSIWIALPRRVRRGDREIRLGPTDFRLLECLVEKPGRVFSRAQLLDLVWGRSADVDERTVDVHIGRLRKRLSKGKERDPIRTVRAAGYAIDEGFGGSDWR